MHSNTQQMMDDDNPPDTMPDETHSENTDTLQVQSVTGLAIELPIAGLGGRSYAYLIDFHIRGLLALGLLVAMYGLSAGMKKYLGIDLDDHDRVSFYYYMAMAILPLSIFMFYHLVLEVFMKGLTPGKRMAGIRIVSKDGITPTQGALVLRNLFRIVDSLPTLYLIGLTTALFSKQHLRIGDMAAGTVLIYTPDKKTQDMQMILPSGDLSAADSDLVRDLLERWKALERPTRIELTAELLQHLGLNVPEYKKPNRQADKAMRVALEAVLIATGTKIG